MLKHEAQTTSLTYEALMQNEAAAARLIEGSYITANTPAELVAAWEGERRFISEAIHKGGSILDFGCANGLLLKSLQTWSPHQLIPYGVDTDEERIHAAKQLFPDCSQHFVTPGEQASLPDEFDFIYWNVWDNFMLDTEEGKRFLDSLIKRTARDGRTILGFYDDRMNNLQKIASLGALGHEPVSILKNNDGEQCVVCLGV